VTTPTSPPTSPPTSWETVLDLLEAEVERAQACLAAGSVPDLETWVAPMTPDAVPEQLRQRALALVDRQEQVTRAIGAALGQTRDHLHSTAREQALAQHVHTAVSATAPPVYLDLVT